MNILRRAVLWYVIGLVLVGLVFVLPPSSLTLEMFLAGELLTYVGNVFIIAALAGQGAQSVQRKAIVAVLLVIAIAALPIEYHLFTTP